MTTTTKATFQKYPTYKDSGVEWLGEIPEGWEMKKLKFLGKIYAGLNGKKGDDFSKEFKEGMKPFIPFTNIYNNFKIDDSKYQFVRISDFDNQNLVKKLDILFLMSSETIEDIGKCSLFDGDNSELYLNSFCKGFRIAYSEVQPYFINYLLKGDSYRKYFSIVGRGFTRINIKQEYINDLIIPIPTPSEQTAIANFLDDKTAKIDQAIAQKEKMIALLKERKQIIIQNAVTKGLDPNVKLKDSGVEWIGEIPEHWEVKKLKFLLNEFNVRSTTGDEELLSLSKYKGVIPKSSLEERAGGAESLIGYKIVKIRQLVINKMQAVNGLLAVSRIHGITSPDYSVYYSKNGSKLDIDYLEHLLLQVDYLAEFKRRVTGVMEGFIRLYTDDLFGISIHLPPIEEQISIIQHIKTISDKIEHSISIEEKQIEKLKEYKATLIDSAVTGKIKVIEN